MCIMDLSPMERVFEKDGQKYLRLGNIAIPFSRVDKEGKPVLDKPVIEDFINADGKPSKRIKVNCLTIKPVPIDL